jgi:hypothetical protein
MTISANDLLLEGWIEVSDGVHFADMTFVRFLAARVHQVQIRRRPPFSKIANANRK